MATTVIRNLLVWQKSMDLAEMVYKVTSTFPAEEKYGMVSQMKRAAVSIPSNIAEGKMRGTEPEFQRFLGIAFGSGGELETQIELARRFAFLDDRNFSALDSLLREVMSMLNVLKT
ncbi:four helix bundle protein [Candidatus Uhrbacteria bacterium]|nr:four helix bundle protein [Candidatus Uhrbacteria bacterium]